MWIKIRTLVDVLGKEILPEVQVWAEAPEDLEIVGQTFRRVTAESAPGAPFEKRIVAEGAEA